ncbi:hypothetical protein HMSSN036_43920 [Paenibacillus macerans]|nr:hypothetical protein HMSSN036_43920 [Paenibacillus macerans]
MNASFKKYAAEFIGTLVLVLFGCGSAATAGGELGNLGIALAFGLSIVAMAYVIGPISGCHINPAVSLAMLLKRKLTGTDFIGYVVAQIAVLLQDLPFCTPSSSPRACQQQGLAKMASAPDMGSGFQP